MKIIKPSQAISRKRDDGTDIVYYILNEYEVHYGELAPGVTQPWHHHQHISETLYVIEGKVTLHYLENEQKVEKIVEPGDLIQVEDTPHTLSNPFNEKCKVIAFRFVPEEKDQREVIKNDKVLHPELDEEQTLVNESQTKNQPCWVYIMECNDGSYYTGVTKDISKRQKLHNTGKGAKYTNSHKPVSLVYFEKHPSRSEAMKREYSIKQLTHTQKEAMVKNFFSTQ